MEKRKIFGECMLLLFVLLVSRTVKTCWKDGEKGRKSLKEKRNEKERLEVVVF